MTSTAPVATVPATSAAAIAASSTSSTDNSTLSSDEFLQLLVAQLKYQDPSQPVDTSSFMQETATLSQVQTMQQLTTDSSSTLLAQQIAAATGMVGHTISYTDSAGNSATGVVSAATVSGTSPTVTVGTTTVPLTSVDQVLSS